MVLHFSQAETSIESALKKPPPAEPFQPVSHQPALDAGPFRPVSAPHPCERGGMQPFSARHSLHARAKPHPLPGCHSSPPIRARCAGLAAHRRPRCSARPRQGRCALSARAPPTPSPALASAAARSPQRRPHACYSMRACIASLAQTLQLKRVWRAWCTGWPCLVASAAWGRSSACS